MKTTFAILAILGACALSAHAEELVVTKPDAEEIVVSETVTEPVKPRASIEGIVKQIFVDKKPWQLVNPVAPAKYGSGKKVVSKDFGPGTPYHSAGVVVLGVEW